MGLAAVTFSKLLSNCLKHNKLAAAAVVKLTYVVNANLTKFIVFLNLFFVDFFIK